MRHMLGGTFTLLAGALVLGCGSSHHASGGTGPAGTQQTNVGNQAPVTSGTPTTLPQATPGQPYSGQLTATNVSAAATWVILSGALPTGIVLASNGTLTGTTSNGATSTTFVAQASDPATGATTQTPYTIVVGSPSFITTSNPLPHGAVNQRYNQTFSGSGVQPLSWVVTGGGVGLPPGLALAPSGVLSGTPTTAGVYNFGVTAQEPMTNGAPGRSSTQNFQLTVDQTANTTPLSIVTPNSLQAATLNVPYSVTLQATGGTNPYTWSTSFNSALPPGLTLNPSNGLISGTPTARGTYTFQVQVVDSSTPTKQTTAATYQLTVN